ncbi:MAG: hypothetical protein LAT75_15195, partial [Candidatus Cyclonatronum sp.]
MKTKLLLLAIVIIVLIPEVSLAHFSGGEGRGDNLHSILNAPPSNFFLADNGVTVMCPDAQVGETGTVIINGNPVEFTKRDRAGLEMLRATDNNAAFATTCTSGVT